MGQRISLKREKLKIWFPTIRGESGTDVYTKRLALALIKRGMEPVITWFPRKYELFPFLLLKAKSPPGTDIIHANTWSGFAFKRKKIPLVITEHHNVFDPAYRPHKTFLQHLYHTFWIRPFVLRTFRCANAVTTVSHYTASSLASVFGIKSSQVIPNCIDTDVFKPQGYSIVGQPFRLLYVGNLSRRKGSDLLEPIMNELGTGFVLHFTTGLRTIKKRQKCFTSASNMKSIGRLDGAEAVIKAYHGCDALLYPSRFEGFGLAPLEAMACGKPVITSDNSALPEVVKDRVTGILCPTDDVKAFAKACISLAENLEILRAYGKAARARVEELFAETKIVLKYIKLYTNFSKYTIKV